MGKKVATFKILGSLIPLALLFGCSMFGESTSPFSGSRAWTPTPRLPEASSALGGLNWTAGVVILGGMVAMVLTAGRMGLRAIVGGVLLVILSYAISVYLHWVMIPVGIFITVVSALWGYQVIIKAWRTRKI